MKEVKIFEHYTLYSDGSIYSSYVDRFIKFSENGRGYLCTLLRYHGKPINIRIHRLVAENFVDNPMQHTEVNHIDGDKYNNHMDNLEWCTRSYNIRHAYDNGLRVKPSGEKNPRNIISEQVVRSVCLDLLCGGKTAAIARKYGVKWHNVDAIRKKKNWASVSDEYFIGVV